MQDEVNRDYQRWWV